MENGENSSVRKAIVEKLIPKKVRFRKEDGDSNNDMMIDLTSEQPVSWKDKLVGQSSKNDITGSERREDFVIMDGDIQKSFVNGVPSITFSERVYKFLIQGMENTVILKLLGRNVGFSVLQSKLYNLWILSATLHMMDTENGYFLVKFQNKLDCEKALSEGPWIIFGQYLTVQPWTAWIRFPGLPGYLYKHKIIIEIEGMVGKMVKLDMNTDSRARGRFARMAVYVELDKPLVSQILINGLKQNMEYESLSTICFSCGRYSHMEKSCMFRNSGVTGEKSFTSHEELSEIRETIRDSSGKKDKNYGPWMIVERKSRRKFRENVQAPVANSKKQTSYLGLGDSSNAQARVILDLPGSVTMAQQKAVVAGCSSSSMVVVDEQSPSTGEMDLLLEVNSGLAQGSPVLEGDIRKEERLAVGNLNPRRHTAVVFYENSNSNKTNPLPNSNKGLIPVSNSGLGKGFGTRGKGISKKWNKVVHASNSHFKFAGSQRVPLKESIEQIAESLLALSKSNLESVEANVLDGQIEGSFAPGQ
ncbi:hypothetical protein GOBAR_AA26805 [Gossypium barbadense]|uniref:CCHC-type domain-containing protein n=1 Tax=Gossypium barbadense TaxID=3634 RepID=A0A2P5WRZ1_GOSBA|nr:hypothetical protein GOBAR_AA26805 [Gossypium barbadense]